MKRSGRPQTVVDNRMIISMVKKSPFTTSSQENTLQEVSVSLSKSTIKKRLHKNKYKGFTTRCKQGQIRLCQKTYKKSQTTSGKLSFGRLKLRSTCTRMMGRKKSMEKAWNSSWSKEYIIICETWWSSVTHEHAWLPVALGYCLLMMW